MSSVLVALFLIALAENPAQAADPSSIPSLPTEAATQSLKNQLSPVELMDIIEEMKKESNDPWLWEEDDSCELI